MSKDWDSLSRKEKKDAAQKTLEMLEQKKKTEMNPLLHLFYLKRIRTLWIYLKRPFAVVVIIVIIWRIILLNPPLQFFLPNPVTIQTLPHL